MKICLIVPTFNANSNNDFYAVLKKIEEQRSNVDLIKVYDSESNDDTLNIVKKFGFEYEIVLQETFSHSGTRSEIAKKMFDNGFSYLIFMTQDVLLQENALYNIISYIKNNDKVALVYGKQEVDLNKGTIFEYYARNFNYGENSLIKSKSDIKKYGIKTIFCSDAFSIYNLNIIRKYNFFGYDTDFAEDMVIADKSISKGYSIGYCAEAKVYHTHNYSIQKEYNRYKIIGKFYRQNDEMTKKYGKTSSNGIKLAIGEVVFLCKNGKLKLVPESLIRNAAKFLGHKIGYYSSRGKIKKGFNYGEQKNT